MIDSMDSFHPSAGIISAICTSTETMEPIVLCLQPSSSSLARFNRRAVVVESRDILPQRAYSTVAGVLPFCTAVSKKGSVVVAVVVAVGRYDDTL